LGLDVGCGVAVYRPAAVEDAGTKLLVEVPKVSGDLVEDQA
jgi:hypothetical protein